MKKKNKSAVAQNLIDSLLDDAPKARTTPSSSKMPPPLASVSNKKNSEPPTQSFGEAPFLRANLDDVPEGEVLGAHKVYNDDGQNPTLMLSMEDEKTSHLRLDANSDLLKPDPLARAEAGERTRLELVRKQAVLDEPPALPEVDEISAPFDLVAPPPSSRAKAQPPMDGTKPLTQPKPARLTPNPAPDVSDALSEKTMRLEPAAAKPTAAEKSVIDHGAATEIRAGAAQKPSMPPPLSGSPSSAYAGSPVGAFSSTEAALKQSENLRIAQERITDLEGELERLRRENEQLATAGETLRRRSDELLAKSESIETSAREAQRIFEEEKKVLRGQLSQKDRESAELRQRLDEMESRLENNFKKIRVRERELEHRLEIVKMESATLVSTKDKMILELKRQIDQLAHENDYAKNKTQELFNQYKDKQETIRRVVRALRIALTILEGDEESVPSKKAE